MANTEGLSDEALSSLLAMPSPEEEEERRRQRPPPRPHPDGTGATPSAAAAAGRGRQQQQQQQRRPRPTAFPRKSLAARERMMEMVEGEAPAATVVRSSRAPRVVRSSASSAKKKINGKASRVVEFEGNDFEREAPPEIFRDADGFGQDGTGESPEDRRAANKKSNNRPVFLSDCIRERPVVAAGVDGSPSATGAAPKRESRFKQRNRGTNGAAVAPTAGGFPSLDIAPVGALTRRGRGRSSARTREAPRPPPDRVGVGSQNRVPATSVANVGKNVGFASESMLAGMSPEEIRDGVEEAESILSASSIEFLRKRGRQKLLAKSKNPVTKKGGADDDIRPQIPAAPDAIATLTREDEIRLEERREREEKEKVADLLTSVRTPEDMDRVYQEALELGIAVELPSSSLDALAEEKHGGEDVNGGDDEGSRNLHVASSLLRSTSPRQRMLGARSLCDILEEDVSKLSERRRAHSYSGSCDDRDSLRKTYPKLLPVAIRCLLDESIATYKTPGGRVLLSTVLRCIHALMTLCVHPYHVVDVSPPTEGCDDPFVLYQTCFMSDVSHVPPGTEMYPPTQITPVGEGDASNATCYRADSSAATAESDSRAFYSDPAWTMLSRMRILPCLSDVVLCLSADYSTGSDISEATISSICGILAMLAVRSPGAAGAIACHKGILPFLLSFCLSPSNGVISKESDQSESKDCANDAGAGLFNTGVTLPALILLCHLARQSRDVAELEVPFQSIIPDLQAILFLEAESEGEVAIQIWSLILLRILFRYGLAVEHVQSLINIAAPRVEMMRPENSLSAQYLLLFAGICDASKMTQHNENDMPTIPESDDCLAMSGVWLSSTARSCINSFQSLVEGRGKNNMKLASAQLRLLASYISTAEPTRGANSIPIVSKESCVEVIEAVLESEMLDSALNMALQASFNAYWVSEFKHGQGRSLEDEAISCSFVTSFMIFAKIVGQDRHESTFDAKLLRKAIDFLERFNRRRCPLTTSMESDINPARKSWFVESEFSLFNILCEESSEQESIWHLLSTFAYSLLGRLDTGHEAFAWFILLQEKLFQVKNEVNGMEISSQSLPRMFLRELSLNDRKMQLNHSTKLFFMNDRDITGSLSSLRCTTGFAGRSNTGEGGPFLPIGGIWMWNVLSSTVMSQPPSAQSQDDSYKELGDIISHTLCLQLKIETVQGTSSYYTSSMKDGVKLYHVANACLLPEVILSNHFIGSALALLFKQFSGFTNRNADLSLVKDFVKACYEHSRVSKELEKQTDKEKVLTEKLHGLLSPEISLSDEYSKDELKTLNDFADDLCNAYIEFGGQYPHFSHFIRLLLRHDFPAKVRTKLLTKLHPILHLLTIEEEDSEELVFSLTQSISGGLPGLHPSCREPSIVLDSFSFSLKKKDKELSRNDYFHLLAVAILARNLSSFKEDSDSGLQAMKNRLSGVSDVVFFDVIQVSDRFRRSAGTKDDLIKCVMFICMDDTKGLKWHDARTQEDWQWNSPDQSAIVWNNAMCRLADDLIGSESLIL